MSGKTTPVIHVRRRQSGIGVVAEIEGVPSFSAHALDPRVAIAAARAAWDVIREQNREGD